MTTRPTERTHTLLVIASAAAPAALAVATAAMLVMGVAGQHPMRPLRAYNLAEAAGSRDAATVVRLLETGEDGTRVRSIRPGVLDERWHHLTPLEAALESRRLEIIDLLLRHGVALDEARRVSFVCTARRRGDRDIVEYLEARGGAVACAEESRP